MTAANARQVAIIELDTASPVFTHSLSGSLEDEDEEDEEGATAVQESHAVLKQTIY